jgi:hypothetical protein
MPRAEASLLVGGLLLAGALAATAADSRALHAAPAAPPPAAPGGPEAAQTPAPDDHDALALRFVKPLAALRAGDASAFDAMLSAAEELCRRFERCDAVRMARYYGALSPEELAQGVRSEREFFALYQELKDASSRELADGDWDALRSEIRRDLDEMVAQNLLQPDYVTAGRALSLTALLEVEQVERDDRLSAPEQADLVLSADAHARRSLQVFERAGFATPALEPKRTLARIALARQETARTREAFTELFADAQHVRRPEYVVHALQGLIWLAQELGDTGEVDRLLGELARFEPPASYWFTARKQAASLFSKDEPERAIALPPSVRPTRDPPPREWHLLMGTAALRPSDLAAAR